VHLPRASNLLSALKADSGVGNFDGESADASHRDTTQGVRPQRDAQTLAIIENLEIGPYEHLAPSDDPNFNGLEPHSSIRLRHGVRSP
jgi:minichromosome maintenance protein 10